MIIMAPSNANECRDMLYTAYQHDGPSAVRYPRGAGPEVNIRKEMNLIPLGKAKKCVDGKKLAILSFGSMLSLAKDVANETGASVIDMRFVKPLDENIINELALSHKVLITLEEGVISGGAGSAVNEYLNAAGLSVPVINLGLPDKFIEHGNPAQLLSDAGLDKEGIILKIEQFLKSQDDSDLIGVA
jgi:1-deoxy-D-xylulose-5-phosphate synthase